MDGDEVLAAPSKLKDVKDALWRATNTGLVAADDYWPLHHARIGDDGVYQCGAVERRVEPFFFCFLGAKNVAWAEAQLGENPLQLTGARHVIKIFDDGWLDAVVAE